MGFLLTLLGVVLILEGMPWFLSPEGVRRLLRQVVLLPDRVLRFGGLAAMLTGLLIVYLAKA